MPVTQFLPTDNNAQSYLASDITDSATSMTVASGHGSRYPDPATEGEYYLTIWDESTNPDPGDDGSMEIVLVTAKSGDTFTITRAQQSTNGVAHSANETVALLINKEHISRLNTAVNNLESDFRVYREFDDFIHAGGDLNWAGTSGYGANLAAGEQDAFGIFSIGNNSAGVWATAYRGNTTSRPIRLGATAVEHELRTRMPTLPDGTNDFIPRLGLFDQTAAEPNNGCYFEFDRTASTTYWRLVTASGGTRTKTTLATAAPVANTWQKLKVVVNDAGTSVDFYIDGTLVGNHTTNIPTGASNQVMPAIQYKWVAGSQMALEVDAHELTCTYASR